MSTRFPASNTISDNRQRREVMVGRDGCEDPCARVHFLQGKLFTTSRAGSQSRAKQTHIAGFSWNRPLTFVCLPTSEAGLTSLQGERVHNCEECRLQVRSPRPYTTTSIFHHFGMSDMVVKAKTCSEVAECLMRAKRTYVRKLNKIAAALFPSWRRLLCPLHEYAIEGTLAPGSSRRHRDETFDRCRLPQ